MSASSTAKSFIFRFRFLLAAILGSVLLWAAWPTSSFTVLIFLAWLPLLWAEDNMKNTKAFAALTYLHMLLWNVLVTWWVANSTIIGGLSAFFVNSLLMCIPILLFRQTKKQWGRWIGYGSFIIYWLAFEYIHLNWDLSWPWLTLGNAFAMQPGWIQWYEYTGSSGGSLWILLSNVIAYFAFTVFTKEGRTGRYFKSLAVWIACVVLPIIISRLVTPGSLNYTQEHNIVVVQPNIDPWDEKFELGKEEAQLQKLIALSESAIDANTSLVVWPETAIPFQADEDQLWHNRNISPVWGFLRNNPQINLLTGLEGTKVFASKNSAYSKAFRGGYSGYYESYNSALLLDTASASIYHKSKLVPGVEVLPRFLGFMSEAFEKFGGTGGGYARDTAAKVLALPNQSYKIAPAICYESIYGDYLTSFIRKGADIICIITNDGWWGNTQGHKQHMNYARLRAIETRKWIARSANTGISCFIDPLGNVLQPQPWDMAATIKMNVPATEGQTYFVKHGDYISCSMLWIGALLLLLSVATAVKQFIERRKKKEKV